MSKIFEALEAARKSRYGQQQDRDPPPVIEDLEPGQERQLVVVQQPGSLIAECFRFLRSNVIRPATGEAPRTVLITSALTGEGKTFIATNLAAAISQSLDEYVLLLDTDMRNPAAHRAFGLRGIKHGLSTHLTESTPLADLLQKTMIDKLTVLPAGNSTKIPAELLGSERMKSLIAEVRNRYPDRYVIIDSPPVELAPETSVIANEVDAVILVVRYGKTPRHTVKAAMEKIRKDKLLGVVFNCYDRPRKLYERYGHKYYGHGERK